MPLRVLHVIGGLDLGGAETLLYRLVTHASPGFEHEVISLGRPSWYSGRLAEHGVRVDHLEVASAAAWPHGLRQLRKLVRDRRPDVVHAWMYLANVASGLAARKADIPVIWSIHASTFEHLGLPSRLCAHFGGWAAPQLCEFVINCSEESQRRHARFGYSRVPGSVIPNGYDPLVFRPDPQSREAARQSLGISRDEFVIGTIGRWHSEKDVPTFLESVKRIRGLGLDARVLMIGPGLDAANGSLAEMSDGKVMALGRREDIPALARALDLHVLSSRSEAFPNVVAETMLSGTPNVVTDVGDSAKMVGGTGWVVPPQDPQRMAEAIAKAYFEWRDRPDPWQRRRAEARAQIADRFTFDRMVEPYRQLWTRFAASR